MADKKLLTATIARVDGPVFSGEVLSLAVPGASGAMELLANHEPLISPLRAGTIKIKKVDGTTEEVAITAGTLEVSNNHATVLI